METSSRDDAEDDLIGQQVSHYLIEALLGVGGMARVYRAHDELLQRDVAIKALAPAYRLESGYVERFRREAQRVAALDHPHIVPILHFIEQGQGLYLVMPLYAESLEDRLNRSKPLPLAEVLQVVSEIGSALSVAHAHGLIHRDVKPGNILLDDEGHAALADFGVAREAGSKGKADPLTLAGSGLTAGTPQYMAPEQLRGVELDHRADLYALGVVLYEMLTGRTPHLGNTPFEVGAAALSGLIIPPSALNADIPPAVEAVLFQALRTRVEDRYATVQGFVEALEDAARQPVAAQPARSATPPLLTPPRPLPWRSQQNSDGAQPGGVVAHTARPSYMRWLALGLLALTMLFVIGGGWIALASAPLTSQFDVPTTRIDGSQLDVTQVAQPTMTMSATVSSVSTPTVTSGLTPIPSATASVTPSPAPSSTATPTTAPTPTLPPPLTLSPLRLTSSGGGQCAGTQTLHNNGTQTITWQWVSIRPNLPPSFVFGVNVPAQFGGFPADLYPGVPPGETDVLNVRMACTSQVYTVTMRDGFGRTRLVTMTSEQ
jgi:serine/threonine-protein kinase